VARDRQVVRLGEGNDSIGRFEVELGRRRVNNRRHELELGGEAVEFFQDQPDGVRMIELFGSDRGTDQEAAMRCFSKRGVSSLSPCGGEDGGYDASQGEALANP
jgi:hypothetical protein